MFVNDMSFMSGKAMFDLFGRGRNCLVSCPVTRASLPGRRLLRVLGTPDNEALKAGNEEPQSPWRIIKKNTHTQRVTIDPQLTVATSEERACMKRGQRG